MGEIAVATVWTGLEKYQSSDVAKIRNMVLRNCGDWDVEFLCYTDQPQVPEGWKKIDLNIYPQPMREGWWGKMQLFDSLFRGSRDVVYFDLDTVIVGDITPLFDFAGKEYFGICRNFTRQVRRDYPCYMGSCVMTIGKGFGDNEFYAWSRAYPKLKASAGVYGDQMVIQDMIPDGQILQDHMPPGFFVGRREFQETLQPGNAVMIFAGKYKPGNSQFSWVEEHWK